MLWFVFVGVFVVKIFSGVCVVVMGVLNNGVYCWWEVEVVLSMDFFVFVIDGMLGDLFDMIEDLYGLLVYCVYFVGVFICRVVLFCC